MGKTVKEKAEAGARRDERLAEQLRANLKRRKAHARGAQAAQTFTERVKEKPE